MSEIDPISVLIADDDAVLRQLLQGILQPRPDIPIANEVADLVRI